MTPQPDDQKPKRPLPKVCVAFIERCPQCGFQATARRLEEAGATLQEHWHAIHG